MLADEILYRLGDLYGQGLWPHDADLTFHLGTGADVDQVKTLLHQWLESRAGYSAWVKDGDHWDHRHPDGIKFHHQDKGCPEFI